MREVVVGLVSPEKQVFDRTRSSEDLRFKKNEDEKTVTSFKRGRQSVLDRARRIFSCWLVDCSGRVCVLCCGRISGDEKAQELRGSRKHTPGKQDIKVGVRTSEKLGKPESSRSLMKRGK